MLAKPFARFIAAATCTLMTVTAFAADTARKPEPGDTEVWSPVPVKVTPGAQPGAPPSDAIVLFDGRNLDAWKSARGDAPAFERLYHATSAKLFGVCVRLLPDRSDAEDAVQEAYAAIWRKAGQYDPTIASPISWLAMIAHNKAIDRLRRDGPAHTTVPLEFAFDVSDHAPTAPALAEHAGETRQLDRCLQQLEARPALIVEHDELAVEDRRSGLHTLGQVGQFGILGGHVVEVGRLQPHAAVTDECERAVSVPLDLVCPVGVVDGKRAERRLHRRNGERQGHEPSVPDRR